ncbi:MAG TPA: indole-3-glycerol-phosphate synthase [Candidatus Altiarchaeales archaeon]|nr:MAG: indole-3-glycerol-phosphate synthase TrpC [Candidatus Altiarchaeales archaeon]HDN83586.1 indole-3-glycerol-phosphate synthase [Candidatus Altiarchaeales archaeon]
MFSLEKVCKEKLEEIEKLKERRSLSLAIENSIKERGIAIISEIKGRSPSEGKLRNLSDIVKIVKEFEAAKVSGISVLTNRYFDGSLSNLKKVKLNSALPVLRKDFIVDEFQIYESYAYGADALLLISRILKEKTKRFVKLSMKLGIEPLVEVHNFQDLKFALDSKAKLIGINNRNLESLEVSLEVTKKLSKHIPKDRIVISESGIKSKEDIEELLKFGVKAFLIGTSLMRANSIREKLDEFYSASKQGK